jgi:hypothetical protein
MNALEIASIAVLDVRGDERPSVEDSASIQTPKKVHYNRE